MEAAALLNMRRTGDPEAPGPPEAATWPEAGNGQCKWRHLQMASQGSGDLVVLPDGSLSRASLVINELGAPEPSGASLTMNPERDVAEHSTSGPAIGASVIQPYSTPPITYQYNREIELGFFSPELRAKLVKFDVDNSGTIDAKELGAAFATMEGIAEANREGSVPLSIFPVDVQEDLKALDENGNGMLDAHEILSGIRALAREKKRRKQLAWVVVALLAFLLILLAAQTGLMFKVIEITKDTAVSGATMTVKGTTNPVQTASFDTMVDANGVLAVREKPENRRMGCGVDNGICPAVPIKNVQNTETQVLSSLMAVENLAELKNMKIAQGNNFILFSVLAVSRYEDPTARHGSVLVIYTHLGEITIDGTAVRFQESIAATFSRAGLIVDATKRRLLGVVEVIGMFNTINHALRDSPELDAAGPSMLPKFFKAKITTLDLCDHDQDTAMYCMLPDSPGTAPDWATFDVSASGVKRAIALEGKQELYSMIINNKIMSKSVTTKAQWPGQSLSVVQNASHKLTFQTYKDTNYWCDLEQTDSLSKVMEGRRKLQDVSDLARRSGPAPEQGMEVTYLGFAVIDDVYCQRFDIIEHGVVEGQKITIYEDYQKKRVFRIQFANFVWRFDELETLNEEDTPLSQIELEIDKIMEKCDPFGIEPPTQIIDGVMTNAMEIQPEWGVQQSYSRALALRNHQVNSASDVPRLMRKTLEQYENDADQAHRRAGSCIGTDIEANALGLSISAEFCKKEHFSFNMLVDSEAPTKLKTMIVSKLPAGAFRAKIQDSLDKVACKCPEVSGEIRSKVPFDPISDVEAAGSVRAIFPAGCCLQTYGPAYGIPPQVGQVLDKLGTKIVIDYGVELKSQEETCINGEYGIIPNNPMFQAKLALQALDVDIDVNEFLPPGLNPACLGSASQIKACAARTALFAIKNQLEPYLAEYGLTFDDALALVSALDINDFKYSNPKEIVRKLVENAVPLAKKATLFKISVSIEPYLAENGLTWEDAMTMIDAISLADLKECVDSMNMESLLQKMLATSLPLAKKAALFRIRAPLEPKLHENGLTWADVLVVMEDFKLDDLKLGMTRKNNYRKEPNVGGWGGKCTCPDGTSYDVGDNFDACQSLACEGGIAGECIKEVLPVIGMKVTCGLTVMDKLLASSISLAKKSALFRLKPILEPRLNEQGLEWEYVVYVVEESVTLDDIKAGNVDAIFSKIIDAAGDLAKIMALFRARQFLEPKLEQNGLTWDDAVELANFVTFEDLQVGITDPEALLEKLIDISAPLAKKSLLYRLKDKLEPVLQKVGLSLQDKMPKISAPSVSVPSVSVPSNFGTLITPGFDMNQAASVAEDAVLTIGEQIIKDIYLEDLKQAALTQDVQPIFDKIIGASTVLAKQVAINSARAALEPKLVATGLAWEDAESVMYLIEIEDLSGDPKTLLDKIKNKAITLAKKAALFQLKSAIEPELVQKGLTFEDAVSVAYVISLDDLTPANTNAILKTMLEECAWLAKKVALHAAKPVLEPKLTQIGLDWNDAKSIVDTISITDLKSAVDNPQGLCDKMIRSSLTLTKKVALIQLRAVLEPKIQGAGLTWDQALTTVTMISLDDIRSGDTETIIEVIKYVIQAHNQNRRALVNHMASLGTAWFSPMRLEPMGLRRRWRVFNRIKERIQSCNGCACPRNYKECIEQAAESAATKAEELARGIAYAASREAEEAKRLAEEAASKTKGLVGSALEKAKDAAAKAKEAAERLQATALDSLEKLEIAANALAEEMAKAWAKLEDGLTVTATAWTRVYILPTLRCPDKQKTMSVGLNFVLGADVLALGFQKSVSFKLIPASGDGGKTCTRQGSDTFSVYNLETNVDEFMMVTPKVAGAAIPCIGA